MKKAPRLAKAGVEGYKKSKRTPAPDQAVAACLRLHGWRLPDCGAGGEQDHQEARTESMTRFTATPYLCLCALGLGLFLGHLYSESFSRTSTQQEAVDRGFAEWHVIEGTSETEFRWKEAP